MRLAWLVLEVTWINGMMILFMLAGIRAWMLGLYTVAQQTLRYVYKI